MDCFALSYFQLASCTTERMNRNLALWRNLSLLHCCPTWTILLSKASLKGDRQKELGCSVQLMLVSYPVLSSTLIAIFIFKELPVCKNFDLSYIASFLTDKMSSFSKEVDCSSWLTALGDHNQLVEGHVINITINY